MHDFIPRFGMDRSLTWNKAGLLRLRTPRMGLYNELRDSGIAADERLSALKLPLEEAN